jgi:hypothetical protein
MPWNQPTKPQLRYLRQLAQQKGRTFAMPSTFDEASAEIDRLKAIGSSTAVERSIDRAEIVREEHPMLNAARVRDDEIVGWGSSARWR